MIACLTIAPFAGAIERSLLPPDQISPLALTGPASNQIHATCEDAQLAGITVGMTVQASYALCPMLVVRPAHLATYQEVRRQIADIAQCAT
ncbi:MAG: hypothetical protein KDD73_17365, partial [Anaerolineales bacterium]|nr:hypothetical protein [Anaerolineales bacterium]